MDPPECPVCGAKERDPRTLACWHCARGDYADCEYRMDIGSLLPRMTSAQRKVWNRLTQILPRDEIDRRLGKRVPVSG